MLGQASKAEITAIETAAKQTPLSGRVELNTIACRLSSSFPTGTMVRMADGTLKPIEHIEPGDQVLTADTDTGEWSNQTVLNQWSHTDTGEMTTAPLEDGSQITGTDHHQFWVDSQGRWVELKNLQPGDHLLTPNGIATVADVETLPKKHTLVWEIDTANTDTYTVSTGAQDLLVHNCNAESARFLLQQIDSKVFQKNITRGEISKKRSRSGGSMKVIVGNQQIDGKFQSVSSEDPRGLLDSPSPKNRVFAPALLENESRIRETDAEYRVLEEVAAQIDAALINQGVYKERPPGQPSSAAKDDAYEGSVVTEAAGEVYVATKSPEGIACDSCKSIIEDFRQRYPNVVLKTEDFVIR